MASPIRTIRKQPVTKEEIVEQNLENLKELVSENKETIHQLFSILNELQEMGALEAAEKLLEAREDVAEIVLGQLTRKPATNLMNHLMNAAGALSTIDPEATKTLANSFTNGLDEAKNALNNDEKLGVFDVLKMLNDPDVNRGLHFALHFLKGFGKSLKE